jgi:hypothetical protein
MALVMRAHGLSLPLCGLTLAAALTACGGSSSKATNALTQAAGTVVGAAKYVAGGGGKPAAAPHTATRTASEPKDPCAWIPVAEVEAIVGPLAGPPEPVDGCRYTLAMPDAVKAARRASIARQQEVQAKLKAMFKDYEPPRYGGVMANYERDASNYAISLKVGLASYGGSGEAGVVAAEKMLQSMFPPARGGASAAKPEPPAPTGWDKEMSIPYGYMGRLGHVSISVSSEAPDMPEAPLRKLAARVRDIVPDLPFPVDNPYQSQFGGPKNPCSLLTRAEAEAVLGPLVVDPYRSSTDYPGLAHEGGYACAYFTAGHHVLVIEPVWDRGPQDFRIQAGADGLFGLVAPTEQVVLEGPWDKAHISPTSGAILVLKGDHLLRVHYTTASTDRRGAVRLAAQAMPRLPY